MALNILQKVQKGSRIKKLVAVAAGKGGVGKSTVCASLARSSALRGLKVGILDADLYGPSIPILFPVEVPVKVAGENIEPALSANIRVLSIAHFGFADQSPAFRAPVVNMFLQQCIHKVDWGELDVLYVDFPPGIGDVHLCLLQEWAFSGVVLVSLPNRMSQSDVEKAASSFSEMGVPVLSILENMASNAAQSMFDQPLFGKVDLQPLVETSKAKIYQKIPFDPRFAALLDQGENPFMQSRLSDAAQAFLAFEEELMQLLDSSPQPEVFKQTLEWQT
jgi:ATP-binding protein involved in chromosome partitioning